MVPTVSSRSRLWVIVLFAVTVFARDADACECASSGPPCQNAFQVDAVFVGTLRSMSMIEGTPDGPMLLDDR